MIPQITYGASIWHISIEEKRKQKALVIQLAQTQALGACLIIRAFKATLAQALKVEAYLTPICFELDKKAD